MWCWVVGISFMPVNLTKCPVLQDILDGSLASLVWEMLLRNSSTDPSLKIWSYTYWHKSRWFSSSCIDAFFLQVGMRLKGCVNESKMGRVTKCLQEEWQNKAKLQNNKVLVKTHWIISCLGLLLICYNSVHMGNNRANELCSVILGCKFSGWKQTNFFCSK